MAEPTIPPEALAVAKALDSTAHPGTDPQVAFSAHAMNAVETAAPYIARAARIDELWKLLELKDTAIEWGVLDWYVRVDDIEERLAELEAPDA